MNFEPPARDFHYIPWSANFIDQAVAVMVSQYGSVAAGYCDLRKHLVVLPSERACRDFESQLLAHTTKGNIRLIKPQIITPVTIPARLFSLPLNVLTEARGLLLATIGAMELAQYEGEPVSTGLRQAGRLLALRRELSAACIAFKDIELLISEYDVPDRVLDEITSFQQLNESYLKKVRDAGLVEIDAFLLDLLRSSRDSKVVQSIDRIHLLACSELKEILVHGISYAAVPTAIYAYAPEEYRDRFDEWGRLYLDGWNDDPVAISDKSLIVVDQSFQQIEAVADLLVDASDTVTVVACDRTLAESFKSGLIHEGYGVECTVNPERGPSSLVTLLDLILRLPLLGARELGNAFFRHPDILRWFDAIVVPPYSRVALAQEWEAFLCNHLPGPAYSVGDFFADDKIARYPVLAITTKTLAEVLPLDIATSELDVIRVTDFMMRIYSVVYDEAPQREYIEKSICEWRELANLEGSSGEILLAVFSHFLKNSAVQNDNSGNEVGIANDHPEDSSQKVRIVGWLDSILDRSSTIFLTSINEGILPEPQRNDYLLPDSAREKLGLLCRKSRDTRDKYILMSILGTGKNVRFFASRAFGSGEGALLSRLILSQNINKSANLILEFFGTTKLAPKIGKKRRMFRNLHRPEKTDIISIVPVGGLAAYKACPYRFYLRYVLGIMPEKDPPREIDGAGFGKIIHQILRDLLLHECQTGSEIGALKSLACQLVDTIYENEFGKFSFSGVGMQMDRLRIRIERFLEHHCRIREDGWETVALEQRLMARVRVPGRGESALPIRGQIDRIDIHKARNEVRIYDYKTGEDSRKTESYHMKNGQMINFQLPAYRCLLEENRSRLGIGDMNVSVAIYNVSAEADNISCNPGEWTEQEYQVINSEIFDILGQIQAGEFNRVADLNDPYSWLIS